MYVVLTFQEHFMDCLLQLFVNVLNNQDLVLLI